MERTMLPATHYSPATITWHGKWWNFPMASAYDAMFMDAAGDRRNGDGTLRPYISYEEYAAGIRATQFSLVDPRTHQKTIKWVRLSKP